MGKFGLEKRTFVAIEGVHTGQFVYCGSGAQLAVGNCMPVGKIAEGTAVSMLEEKVGDRGAVARASGTSCVIVGHSDDGRKTVCGCPQVQGRPSHPVAALS